MIKVISEADKVCVAKANEAGQGHLFEGWDDLSPEAQKRLIDQVEGIDFQLTRRLVEEHIHGRGRADRVQGRVLKPAPSTRLDPGAMGKEEAELCLTLGEYAIRSGEVALVTAAAGSWGGTEPVGMLAAGPVTGKSLFQLHAEKIQAINRRYRTSLRWSIFCHPDERDRILAHFRSNGYFGLKCSDMALIPQELLPVVDRRGKILLSEPGKVAAVPSGHGGILLHLIEDESLEAYRRAGVRYLFYFQVDNPLVRIADPVFLGHHIKTQSEVSIKSVRKVDPDERVGVICLVNGVLEVVEHTELCEEDRRRQAEDGGLLLSAANTGIHAFSVDFLSRMRNEGVQLPFHAVEKATASWARGKVAGAVKPNSVKFSLFIFDAIRRASRPSILEVERADEFSPVKCPTGPASLETARRDLSRLHARWLREACRGVPEGAGTDAGPAVEISPLYALDARELKEKGEAAVTALLEAAASSVRAPPPSRNGGRGARPADHGGILLGGPA
jgi:UDP-N-acetylglucosamine/UDP-N-acetylgalactosamine diphosphorylase